MKRIFIAVLMISAFYNLYSQSSTDVSRVASYIKGLQYTDPSKPSYGALKKGRNPEIGGVYYKIEPYFSNIGALGLLDSKEADKLTVVKNWMNWYVGKMNPLLVNYFYDSAGENETTCDPNGICNDIDAQDSDPTLFFLVLEKYIQKGGDLSWFTPEIKYKLEAAADFVIALTNPNVGLTMTKISHSIMYTMDNSEVYAGMQALANIEAAVYGDNSKSSYYNTYASNLRTNILSSVYPVNPGSIVFTDYKLYGMPSTCTTTVNSIGLGDIYSFIPSLWPQLFGVDAPTSSQSVFAWNLLNSNFAWTSGTWLTNSKNPSGQWWCALGYLATKRGDTVNGTAQATQAAGYFGPTCTSAACYIGDAGWLLMNLAVLVP